VRARLDAKRGICARKRLAESDVGRVGHHGVKDGPRAAQKCEKDKEKHDGETLFLLMSIRASFFNPGLGSFRGTFIPWLNTV
jgi:hypothetical protein